MAKKASPTVEELLKNAGVNDATIDILREQDLMDEQSLRDTSVAELTGAGIVLGQAKKVKKAYPSADTSAPATTPSQPGPINVTVQTGNLEDKTLAELLTLAAAGDRSTELKQALRQKTGGRACFVRAENGDKLDPVATMECYDYVSEVGRVEMWGGIPVESLDEIWDKRREADPLSGEALVNGKAQDGVDWTSVPEQHRVYAAFAHLNNLLPAGVDRFTLVEELHQSDIGGRWAPIVARFKQAEKVAPEKVATARAALVYRKGGAASSASPFRNNASGNADALARW